jgi:hypothetical protein
MFASKEKNFIYLRTPKTGSTSMSNYLIDKLGGDQGATYTMINLLNMSGKNLPEGLEGFNPHSSIAHIIESGIADAEFVAQANIYACLRNPVGRFLSRCYHVKHFDKHPFAQGMNKNQLVELVLSMVEMNWHMWKPQTTWCTLNGAPVNKLFLYENFEVAASEMTGVEKPVYYRHRADCSEFADTTPLDNSLVQQIETLYADDVALYNSLCSLH